MIYSVDPYGLANYVKLYSDLCYGGSTADKLSYKDYVFELIYGYPPKYYTRISLGDWRETENISNLNVVLSESEFIFGMHMIYDSETIAELVEIAADMIISLISCVNPVISEAVDVVCSFGTWIHNVIYKKQLIDFEGMASDEIDSIIDETMMELGLDWAYNCISFGNSLDELLQLISDYPHYEIAINRCMEDLPYNVYIKPQNGAKYAVSEIYDVLNQE